MDESGTSTETALKFFEETFQPNLASEIAGTYQVYQWEDHLQIIVLDIRGFGTQSAVRDSDEEEDDELVSMLGDEQWKWFEQQVKSVSSDPLQIVVSPIQILATGHSFDCWNRIPNERRRLLDLLSSHHVLLLSGDRHMSALYHSQAQMSDQSNDDRREVYEIIASSLTHTVPYGLLNDEHDEMQISPFVYENNFGMLDLTRYQEERVVQSTIRSTVTGEILDSWDLPISYKI